MVKKIDFIPLYNHAFASQIINSQTQQANNQQ